MKILYATTLIMAGSDLLFFHGGIMAKVSRVAGKSLRALWSTFKRKLPFLKVQDGNRAVGGWYFVRRPVRVALLRSERSSLHHPLKRVSTSGTPP